jgi:preprotein translocase subunit SecA
VIVVPTNLPMIRIDNPDIVYKTPRAKYAAVVREIEECYQKGQPVLVGTTSIEKNEIVDKFLKKKGIPHNVLNAKYHEKEAKILAEAGRKKAVTVATNMAGRGVDIILGGQPPNKFKVQSFDKLRIDPEQSRTGQSSKFTEIIKIRDESNYTYYLTKFLIDHFPDKKIVFDAGALQMMEKEWLLKIKEKPILTPHQIEFQTLFGIDIKDLAKIQKKKIIKEQAKKFNCLVLVKAVSDIISDGKEVFEIQGGNAGLTKGGTGDVLAGLIAAFYTKNDPLISTVLASFILKKSAEELFKQVGFYYNATDLVHQIPKTMKKVLFSVI